MKEYQDNIKCTVTDCVYYASGNHCGASAIEVNVDNGGKTAHTSTATQCHTFEKIS